jgi:hypothetical protein
MLTDQCKGRLGEFEFDDVPLPIQRLYSPDKVHAHDTSASAIVVVTRQQLLDMRGGVPIEGYNEIIVLMIRFVLFIISASVIFELGKAFHH